MSTTLLAWYIGKQVLLTVPDNSLVFDGVNFVLPKQAKWVMLAQVTPVGYITPGHVAFPTPDLQAVILLQDSSYQCKVDGWDESLDTGDPPDVISVVDPNNGDCVCFVTCQGTDLTFVQVTVVPLDIVINPLPTH